jgi:hypothetical protein
VGRSPIRARRVFVLSGPFDEDEVPEIVEAPPKDFQPAWETSVDGIRIYRLRTRAARPPAIDWRQQAQSATAVLVAPAR